MVHVNDAEAANFIAYFSALCVSYKRHKSVKIFTKNIIWHAWPRNKNNKVNPQIKKASK